MIDRVCWIKNINYSEADPELRSIYDQVLTPTGQLDNLYRGFSLSSQTILPADALYKAALHHKDNVLAKAFSELVGTYVASLAGCDYAKAHHGQNYLALSDNSEQAHSTLAAVCADELDACTTKRNITALKYVRKLCLEPSTTRQSDIQALRTEGWDDSEISELVQVVAMFSYFVRVINGVGIKLGDEKLGFY